jgi:hypothetical protein
MSPEQAAGDLAALGTRSDVYSLGATLYTLLTGRRPFDGHDLGAVLRRVQAGEFPTPRAVDPSIDRALEAVCLRAMSLRPEDRYPSCRALADDVERWTADEPVSAYPEGVRARASRWSRRHRAWVQAGAVALAGLLALSVAFAVQQARYADGLRREQETTKNALAAEARERQRADRERRGALRSLANLHYERGLARLGASDVTAWLLSLARSAEVTPADEDLRQEPIRRTLSAWKHVQPLKAILAHDSSVVSVAFSPDGRLALTGSRDGTARLWGTADGAPVGSPMKHGGPLTSVAFSPDGRLAMTGSHDGTARLWGTADGAPVGSPM